MTQTGQPGGTYSSTAGLVIDPVTGQINLTASTGGLYTITYTFTNGLCPSTTTTNVTINTLPVATIAYPGSPYCATGTAGVTQTGQIGGTYASTAGLVIDPVTGQVNLATSTAGTYTVTYSFSNGTCSSTATALITIVAMPVATISYPASPYCATGNAAVTQTGQAGGTYSSTAGLVIDPVTGLVNLATSTPGTYTVTYNFASGACTGSTTTSITVTALPVATIAYAASPYCATGTATVTQTGQAGGTYSSTAGLVINPATGAINLATSTAGTYTVTYTFTSGACASTTTALVTINALPVATIAYPGTPYCAVGLAAVTQTGQGGGTYSSTPGLTLDPVTGTVTLGTSTAGIYTVTYTFTNGICASTATTTIAVDLKPTVVITNPAPVCSPATVDITAPAVTAGSTGGLTYTYFTDPAGTIVLANPTAIAASGTYYIVGTTAAGCTSTVQPVTVVINPVPPIAVSPAETICKGTPVTLTATSAGNSLEWLGIGPGAVQVVNPTVTTTYSAVATSPAGCSDTAQVTITINPFQVTLTANPNPVEAGKTLTLSTSSDSTYTVLAWLPASDFPDQIATIQAITATGTNQQFEVIAASPGGCLDTAILQVTVTPDTKDFYIPNAFTPNGDGKNDVFKVYGSSIAQLQLRVFNQWGQLIFETTDQTKGWDGTYNGNPQPVGAYSYLVRAVLFGGEIIIKRGNVNLIR